MAEIADTSDQRRGETSAFRRTQRPRPKLPEPLAARTLENREPYEIELSRHRGFRRSDGFGINANLLGEAVLGEGEAECRYSQTLLLLNEPDIDYVSVKLSSLVSRINYRDYGPCMDKVTNRLRALLHHAATTDPPTFINLDMEEYHDLGLTLAAFMSVLDEPKLRHVTAGIVLQAYLPGAFDALQRLVTWVHERQERTADGWAAGEIKVRLEKGANLTLEGVDAAIHGWPQAPYETKAETDANYKRCLDWLLTPERTRAVRVGVASCDDRGGCPWRFGVGGPSE